MSIQHQGLDIRLLWHIPFHIRTNTSNQSIVSNNQAPPSVIARHLLDNPTRAAAYNPSMFTNIVSSCNELHLSILEALLITKIQPELYIQKYFYTLILIINPLGPKEVNTTLAKSAGLR